MWNLWPLSFDTSLCTKDGNSSSVRSLLLSTGLSGKVTSHRTGYCRRVHICTQSPSSCLVRRSVDPRYLTLLKITHRKKSSYFSVPLQTVSRSSKVRFPLPYTLSCTNFYVQYIPITTVDTISVPHLLLLLWPTPSSKCEEHFPEHLSQLSSLKREAHPSMSPKIRPFLYKSKHLTKEILYWQRRKGDNRKMDT